MDPRRPGADRYVDLHQRRDLPGVDRRQPARPGGHARAHGHVRYVAGRSRGGPGRLAERDCPKRRDAPQRCADGVRTLSRIHAHRECERVSALGVLGRILKF